MVNNVQGPPNLNRTHHHNPEPHRPLIQACRDKVNAIAKNTIKNRKFSEV